MKFNLTILFLLFGLSFSVKAGYFNYEAPGIKKQNTKTIVFKETIKLPPPQFVLADGVYHPITQNEYPYYSAHTSFTSGFLGHCFGPRSAAPWGTLWMESATGSLTAFFKTKQLAFNRFLKNVGKADIKREPSFQLCGNCKFKPNVSTPNKPFHQKQSDKLQYYFGSF